MSPYTWRKSSYSGNAANCVYVRNDHDGTLQLRESDVPDTILATRPTAFGAFIRAAKAGALDHLTTPAWRPGSAEFNEAGGAGCGQPGDDAV